MRAAASDAVLGRPVYQVCTRPSSYFHATKERHEGGQKAALRRAGRPDEVQSQYAAPLAAQLACGICSLLAPRDHLPLRPVVPGLCTPGAKVSESLTTTWLRQA